VLTVGPVTRDASSDPAELVARVAASRRDRLLRIHRQRLRFEDLEDCYSQATLELLLRSRRSPFADPEHIKNALEQKFVSRINDRRRALGGRSGIEAAMANAVCVDAPEAGAELEDRLAGVERQVLAHAEVRRLREVIAELSLDQRLVLHSQVSLQMEAQEFCARYGWSPEKFRKVAQRGRNKLRALVDEYQSGERCRRLAPDLAAFAAHAGSDAQIRRARAHLENCTGCSRSLSGPEHRLRGLSAIAPIITAAPLAALLRLRPMRGIAARTSIALRRHLTGPGLVGTTAGSTAGLASTKAAVMAICIAGVAGGYTLCQPSLSPLPLGGGSSHPAHVVRHETSIREVSRPRSTSAPRIEPTPGAVLAAHQRSLNAQVRREFGRHHATAATVPSATRDDGALSQQPSAAAQQETREFGFER